MTKPATSAKPDGEAHVHDALRSALPDEYRLYPNVRWIHKEHRDAPARDGETDMVVLHPEFGLLIVETKGWDHPARREWPLVVRKVPIEPPPFEQAEKSKHTLVRKLIGLPDWPGHGSDIRSGHAVAFPDVDLSTVAHPERGLGPDASPTLVLDRATMTSETSVKEWVLNAYDYWVGDGRRGRSMTDSEVAIADEVLSPAPMEITSALRHDIESGEAEVVKLTRGQLLVLETLKAQQRAAIVGPAGCGKTMLAAEKARQLARKGYRTLLVCFNQPLAKMLDRELAGSAASGGGLDALTFHELCLRMGREYELLPRPEPVDKGSEWFDSTLPSALEAAIDRERDPYHAVVVDEGQDFERSWLESLDLLLRQPGEGVFYVFHDPGQALYREDIVASMDLPEYDVAWNCRNPAPIHELAAQHARLDEVAVLREEGRAPELIKAAPGKETTEALRKVLHRLVVVERVPRDQIVVLTGRSLAKSDAWHQRRYGDQLLWNGSYDDAGESLGLSADAAPEQPVDAILCDSIRRFKGLEREVVVLVELDTGDRRYDQLMYVGATRAREHLVVIASEGA